MKEFQLNLQQFDDPATYTVTCLADSGFSAFSASPASGVKTTEVTLTVTPATGYELDEIEVCAGGVTINPTTKKFAIGEANVVLYAKSKANNIYKVAENTVVNVNGTKTELVRNMKIVTSKSGAIVDVESSGTALTISADVIASLVDQGILVKI